MYALGAVGVRQLQLFYEVDVRALTFWLLLRPSPRGSLCKNTVVDSSTFGDWLV